jgi:hypothetical protein
MGRHLHLLLALAWVGVGGCATILGDFSGGGSGAAGEGGSQDGADDGAADTAGDQGALRADASDASAGQDVVAGDGTAADSATRDAAVDSAAQADAARGDASDGSSDSEGAAPLGTLTCDQWALATPFIVENRNGLSPSGYSNLTAFDASPTTTRVVGTLGGAAVFVVHSIDSSAATPVVTSISLAGSGTVVATTRVAGGFGVVVQTPTSATATNLSLYVFRDAAPVTPLPAPVPLATLQSTVPSALGAVVVELGAGIYYVALTSQDSSASLYALSTGIATGGAAANVTTVDTSGSNDFQVPAAVHAGATIYLFVSSHLGQSGLYALPDSGTTSGVSRTAVPGLGLGQVFFGGIVDGVPGSASGRTNLAYLEEDANDAAALGAIAYRAAPVDNAQLSTITASQIAYGKTYTDPAVGPFSPNARLFGDDFVAMAPGLTTSGNMTAWANFLWLDVNGVVRGERSGAVQGLLPGRGIYIRRMSLAPGPRSPTTAAWNVGWSEYDPDASNSDTLKFNTLQCH